MRSPGELRRMRYGSTEQTIAGGLDVRTLVPQHDHAR
jgi:hypothetical protein